MKSTKCAFQTCFILIMAIALLITTGAALGEEMIVSEQITANAVEELNLTIENCFNLLNEDDIPGIPSLFWPWVIETTGRIEDALGRYYMYFSTDHADKHSAVHMAYSDNLVSGWTYYGPVYASMDNGPLETETPSVIWHNELNKLIMFCQSADSYKNESQTSWRVESYDGIEWTNRVKLFKLDGKRLFGNLHNGYVMPFEYKGLLFAYSLMGGGNGATALS